MTTAIGFRARHFMSAALFAATLLSSAGAGIARAQSTGQSPSAKTESPDDDKAFIIDFLEKGYLQAWFAHPASVRQHFSDPVAVYWNRRNVDLDEVVKEKLGYARKWIFRFYRLNRDSVKLEAVAGKPYAWRVTFEYDFIADSSPPRSAGVGETTLLLEIQGDQVKIHGESGRILERKRKGASSDE